MKKMHVWFQAGAVPCKRPAAEKGGVPVYANGATAQLAAAAQVPQATFNPYLIPGIGYMPTVSCKCTLFLTAAFKFSKSESSW